MEQYPPNMVRWEDTRMQIPNTLQHHITSMAWYIHHTEALVYPKLQSLDLQFIEIPMMSWNYGGFHEDSLKIIQDLSYLSMKFHEVIGWDPHYYCPWNSEVMKFHEKLLLIHILYPGFIIMNLLNLSMKFHEKLEDQNYLSPQIDSKLFMKFTKFHHI